MNFKEFHDAYYAEEYLRSEFTFGFELEGFAHNKDALHDIMIKHFGENIEDMGEDCSLDNGSCDICGNEGQIECEWCNGHGTIPCSDCDGSGMKDCDTCQSGGDIPCSACDGTGKDGDNDCEECDGSGNVTCPDCGGDGQVDCSCDHGNEDCPECGGDGYTTCPECGGSSARNNSTGRPFEWPSPVFKVTPSDLAKVVKFFEEANTKNMFEVNDTCGFHVHLGLSAEFHKQEDWFWVLCCLATDQFEHDGNNLVDHFVNGLGEWDFFHDRYAGMDYINEIRDALSDKANLRYREEKFELFHIHPQGTLEWRGPRGFVISQKHVREFFLHMLPDLVTFLAKAQHATTITFNGKTFTKQQIFDMVKDSYQRESSSLYRKRNKKYGDRFHVTGTIGALFQECLRIAGKWVTKLQGMYIEVVPTDNKQNVILTGGYIQDGEIYGIVNDARFAEHYPKQKMKGLWVKGRIGNKYFGAKEAAEYFGYNLQERFEKTKGAEQFIDSLPSEIK